MTIKKMLASSLVTKIAGQTTITGTQDWTVPAGVSCLSILGVEQGLAGSPGQSGGTYSPGGAGGSGGNVRYLNNLVVSAGQVLTVTITSATFSVADKASGSVLLNGTTGGVSLGKAGTGATGGAGGSGTGLGGGVGGGGGLAVAISNPAMLVPGIPLGGGTNSGNNGGLGGTGLFPGGGGGGGGGGTGTGVGSSGGPGGAGCVRIIWPGDLRLFPSTRTADEVPGEIAWSLVSHPDGSLGSLTYGACTNGTGTWLMLPNSSVAAGLTYYLSTDNGRTFQARTFNVGSAATYRTCVRTNGYFIVGTSLGTIRRSTDGISWTEVIVVSGQNILASAYADGVLTLALNNKTVRRSTDEGLTSTASTTSAFSGFATKAAAGNGVILIGDTTDNPKKSVNLGLNFTTMASADFSNSGINIFPMFSDGLFTATVGSSIVYMGNANATVFTASNVPGSGSLNRAAHFSGRYYAAGTVSRFMEMKDGTSTWQNPITISNNLIAANISIGLIESDGFGVIMVIGNYGLLMRGELK